MTVLTDPTERRASDLDHEVAREVMGWELLKCGCPESNWFPPGEFKAAPVPAYSTDLNLAALVEAEIARRGLEYAYQLELSRVVNGRAPVAAPSWEVWRMVTATAEQRCRAALSAVRASAGREEEG